jgi:hypothetical protein
MKHKQILGLVMTFLLVFGMTAGFYISAGAGYEPPPLEPKCAPWDPYVVAGHCCDAPNNGLGVYTATGCLYADNISCSCSGLGPNGSNPYGCELYCGNAQ